MSRPVNTRNILSRAREAFLPASPSASQKTCDKRVLLWLTLLALLQLTTLNLPWLNGDEAVYVLILDQWRKITQGGLPDLNPLISYAGPLDFWTLSIPYAIFSKFLRPDAWMIRITPLALFWIGTILLYIEARNWGQRRASWFLFLAGFTPLTLVYSRVTFPHALLLAGFSVFLAETLRLERTGTFRFLPTLIAGAICIEAHPSSYIGFALLLAAGAPAFLTEWRRRPLQLAVLAGGLLFFALPELRNLPFPVGGQIKGSFYLQLRAGLRILVGHHPARYWFGDDPSPAALNVVYGLLLLGLLGFQLKALLAHDQHPDGQNRFWLRLWLTHAAGILLIMWICRNGRSLDAVGDERYLFVLVPGCLLLQADAWDRFLDWLSSLRIHQRVNSRSDWAHRLETLAFVLLAAFSILRFERPLLLARSEKDPSFLAAQWLLAKCPQESCLASTESFWNFWPIRYYSRDVLPLNTFLPDWSPAPKIPANGRELAYCGFHPRPEFERTAREKIQIPPGAFGPAQFCYLGFRELP